MHAAGDLSFAAIGIPNAWQCLVVASPFLFIAAVKWLVGITDVFIKQLFPYWEWEKQLGWLNIRAHRRAELFWRWFGYFIYATLALALYGIVWASSALSNPAAWSDPNLVPDLMAKVATLLVCLGYWLVYLGCELLPKLRRQYEDEELQRYRVEMAAREEESETRPASRHGATDLKSWKKPLSPKLGNRARRN